MCFLLSFFLSHLIFLSSSSIYSKTIGWLRSLTSSISEIWINFWQTLCVIVHSLPFGMMIRNRNGPLFDGILLDEHEKEESERERGQKCLRFKWSRTSLHACSSFRYVCFTNLSMVTCGECFFDFLFCRSLSLLANEWASAMTGIVNSLNILCVECDSSDSLQLEWTRHLARALRSTDRL